MVVRVMHVAALNCEGIAIANGRQDGVRGDALRVAAVLQQDELVLRVAQVSAGVIAKVRPMELRFFGGRFPRIHQWVELSRGFRAFGPLCRSWLRSALGSGP